MVARLSGGQKARLSLLLATIDAPHLLILDEPTNHLDMESREALVEALTEYTGAVILVSHDMHLLGLVADRLWLVKDGAVMPFTEDLEAYRRQLLSSDEPAKDRAAAEKPKRASREDVALLRSEVRKCEERVEKLNGMRDKLATKLADPELYEPARLGELETWQKKYAEVMEGARPGRGALAQGRKPPRGGDRVMETSFLITAFVTLFVVIDPPGLIPQFIALTQGMTRTHRRAIGLRACVIAAVVLTLFGLFGEAVLGFVGISMPAFRIAGGILLFLTALDMLFERRTQRREGQKSDPQHDPSVFPLATPLIAGPGAIASMILLVGQSGPGWGGTIAIHLLMLGVIGLCFLLFLVADPIERALGRTGTIVITRLLGMLLAALSVQFVIDGIIGTGLLD